MSEYEVQSRRKEPSTWAPLLEVAETAVPADGYQWGHSQGMRSLYDGLQELSMTGLTELSFYGYGLAICEVAKGLRDPAVRAGIVENGADALIRASAQVNGGVSAITESPTYLEDAYAGLFRRSYDRRPASERLVGEMALSLTFERENTIRPKLWVPKSLREERYADLSERLVQRMNRDVVVDLDINPQDGGLVVLEIQKMPRMENIMLQNIVLSAAYVAAQVLHSSNPRLQYGELPSQEAIDTLRHHFTKQAALQACRVTSNDFFNRHSPIIEVIADQAVFKDPLNGGKRPRPSRLKGVFQYGWRGRQYYQRTNEPLVCPAADVRGMVPLSLDLVGRIIETATGRLTQAKDASTQS